MNVVEEQDYDGELPTMEEKARQLFGQLLRRALDVAGGMECGTDPTLRLVLLDAMLVGAALNSAREAASELGSLERTERARARHGRVSTECTELLEKRVLGLFDGQPTTAEQRREQSLAACEQVLRELREGMLKRA